MELKDTTITCVTCGKKFETASTKEDLKVDTCSNCHPFWAKGSKGTTKGGRAEKFKEKYKI